MELILAALLAGKTVLPSIDRYSLELQARAESLQLAPQRAKAVARARIRPASGSNALDLQSITTICRAAGNQANPADFVARLSRAYAMSSDEAASLRSSCAAYLAGNADARRTLRNR